VPATSLLSGYGVKVCIILNLLADKALLSLNHKWKSFKYPSENINDTPNTDVPIGDDIDEVFTLSILFLKYRLIKI
jgi:hypothetical protein